MCLAWAIELALLGGRARGWWLRSGRSGCRQVLDRSSGRHHRAGDGRSANRLEGSLEVRWLVVGISTSPARSSLRSSPRLGFWAEAGKGGVPSQTRDDGDDQTSLHKDEIGILTAGGWMDAALCTNNKTCWEMHLSEEGTVRRALTNYRDGQEAATATSANSLAAAAAEQRGRRARLTVRGFRSESGIANRRGSTSAVMCHLARAHALVTCKVRGRIRDGQRAAAA